jgi:hypothetical protein
MGLEFVCSRLLSGYACCVSDALVDRPVASTAYNLVGLGAGIGGAIGFFGPSSLSGGASA